VDVQLHHVSAWLCSFCITGKHVSLCEMVQVLGGLLLHQQRYQRNLLCDVRFAKLSSKCLVAGEVALKSDAELLGTTPTSDPVRLKGYGTDAAFLHNSDLFNEDAAANIADFYNMSASAGEVAPQGSPFAFFAMSLPTFPPGFPVLFEVGLHAGLSSSLMAICMLSNTATLTGYTGCSSLINLVEIKPTPMSRATCWCVMPFNLIQSFKSALGRSDDLRM
jgi:hypothetical protein